MNEMDFRNWMTENGAKRKVISDCVSRLKRIEREFDHCDLDEEYRSDRCTFLMDAFELMGQNDKMRQFPNADFPIGKHYMSTYRHSLKKYVTFCDSTIISEQK